MSRLTSKGQESQGLYYLNRHLIKIERSLIFNTNIPVHHWRKAVLIVWLLINRMSSSSLENEIPHSIIFPSDPLFCS